MGMAGDAERLCEALWAAGGSSVLSELAGSLPEDLRASGARSRAVSAAVRQGWASKAGSRISLTDKGRSRFGPYHLRRESALAREPEPEVPYIVPAAELNGIISRIPMQHGFYVRLVIDAVIARYHLADIRNEPWPGFMAIGGSGTGKTTMHRLLCRLFGFDPVPITVNLTQAHTRGQLKGKVIPGQGFTPSPYMLAPYLAFEEVDKDPSLISLVDPYFLGEIRQSSGGISYRILPVPALYANPPDKGDRYSLMHPAWRRRSVFLDTQYMSRKDKGSIEDFADWLDNPDSIPEALLRLEAFSVPERLPEQAKAVLQSVKELLSPDFRDRDLYCGLGPLELMTLGQQALTGMSPEISAWHVGLFYLAVTATIPGQVISDAFPIWESLYDLAGSPLAVLRASVRSLRAQSEERRRSAEIARRESPEDLLLASMREERKKLSALREIDKHLELFNPNLFYDGTDEIEIAEAYGDDLRIVRRRIAVARNANELAVILSVKSKILAEALPYSGRLRRELQRIERLETEEPEEPATETVPVSNAPTGKPLCERCGSPAILQAEIYKPGGETARAKLCLGDYAGVKSQSELSGYTISVIDRYPVTLQAPPRLAITSGPRLGSSFARCVFSHIIARRASSVIVASMYYPSSYMRANSASGERRIPCCSACRDKAIQYAGSLGYPYYREENI